MKESPAPAPEDRVPLKTMVADGRGDLVCGWMPGLTGFAANEAVPRPGTNFWFRSKLAGIPILGLLLVAILIAQSPPTQPGMTEIRAQPEARRDKV